MLDLDNALRIWHWIWQMSECAGDHEQGRRVTEATRRDAAALAALDERNFAPGDRFSERLWRTILDQSAKGKMLTLIAWMHDCVVGAIVGEFHVRRGTLTVWSIAVDAAQRGSGLAGQLMAELVRRTPPACTRVVLDARRDNPRARRFYERLGFRETGEKRGAYADGVDAIRYASGLQKLRDALLTVESGQRFHISPEPVANSPTS